ncbi:MAG: hypothetical protein ACRENJ_03455 [Candidatus Eiseniibacteriota bacterium]
MGVAHGAHAGWSPDGVTVRETSVRIPVVAACSDGATGTFVAWQESGSDPNGPLRAQHLLSTGDLDPAWPADGALASGVLAARGFLDLVPDRLGGVYACWMEGPALFVTRIDPTGQVAAGWPASGKSLGPASSLFGRLKVIEDGSHGSFVGWVVGSQVVVQRLGTDGLSAGGWTNGPEVVAPSGPVQAIHFWPDLALGPDGSVFVSWATWSTDTTVVESGMYLRRLTGAGDNSSGWPAGGIYLGSFRLEVGLDAGESLASLSPLLGISGDDRGGLFCVLGMIWGADGLAALDIRLRRLLADGQPAPGWPAMGREAMGGEWYGWFWGAGPDGGLGVHPDGLDGALVEHGQVVLHSPPVTRLYRCTDAGQWSWQLAGLSDGHQVVAKGDGGAFMAEFHFKGRFGINTPNAFIAVDQSCQPPGWSPWIERHTEYGLDWFGDIALAPAGDGGVVFFWSQHRERFGLFARKFSTAGQVTAVEPVRAPGSSPLEHLRFVDGAGIVARIELEGGPARLELFDVGGRRISSLTLGEAGAVVDVTLPGTESLAAGLYFVRLAWEASAAFGRVPVIR